MATIVIRLLPFQQPQTKLCHDRLIPCLQPMLKSQRLPPFFLFSSTIFDQIPKQDYVRSIFSSSFIVHFPDDGLPLPGVMLFVFLTFVVRVILSPTLSVVFVAISYSLVWLPQIVRSVRRGRSSGLAKEYIIGTTICRLYLALCEFS